ncbi:enoyl-CoA hydratase/isomerase family protein [Pseudonocardia nigra]|uniref:enoyl-CoA hydratase/isomerase family protein n=1 Tax=Pseudonocardia nigra TaxID=1921578 RepID=UPI001C5D4A07|nr:enoyl-CoA hydratase/isomerase family protein [Pseudonocardia nigra]
MSTTADAATRGTVEIRRDGDVAVLTLARPAKLNALSTYLENELLGALRSAEVRAARAVVVTGAGRAFSAGADVTELPAMTPEAIDAYYRGSGAVYEAVADLPQPTVAAVAGYCLGGGFELALACDLRVADPGAVFGLPEIGLGILPGSGGVHRLVRAAGPALARDLILRGRRMEASEAFRRGLLTEVTEPGRQVDRAVEIATELAVAPALAVATAKQLIDGAAEASRETGLLLERLAYAALNRTGPT